MNINPKQIGNPGKSPGRYIMIMMIMVTCINLLMSALRYELMLKEESSRVGSKATITTERINMCFEIFGQLSFLH